MIGAITLLLGCHLLGELFIAATGLPLPGPVVGMVILFTGLMTRGGVPDSVAQVSDTLLRNLSLLFVPAGVGVMLHLSLIEKEWLGVTAALIGSSAITVIFTALLMVGLKKLSHLGAND
ncbi:CidA/LrgA family protein [Nisaea acidiphila]|uniref:CidA/LrgA family protein n=1 Tax=Nisaea acidiphila TaxID=1862145 RepID=A0A9J7AN90_9PROT|nr:CidA/LrgA family protein [Nisaea acidiphila]UUX49107.1 CidA/LrgA family protein [Nisaea acidiphila]